MLNKMFENYPDIITVEHLMEMLNIGKSSAYSLLKSKQIQHVRVGRKSSYRVLPLNPSLKAFLLRLRAQQAQDKLTLGQAYQNTEYVCRWSDGHALSPSYMSTAFNRLLRENNLEIVRLHDLRHSCASYMLKTDCNMKEISDWLGHSDIGTSMNLYAHVDVEAKKDVSNRLGSILSL